jgi:uncharacterized protein YjiS (DUF1127 family)
LRLPDGCGAPEQYSWRQTARIGIEKLAGRVLSAATHTKQFGFEPSSPARDQRLRLRAFDARIHDTKDTIMLTNPIDAFRRWVSYRRNLRALSRLDDRMLRDIGLNRSGLSYTAWTSER